MARQSQHAPAKVLCSLRQREAAELRAQKLKLDDIASEMGISKPRVHQLLKSWDENFKSENVDRAEQMTVELLEEARLLKCVWLKRALDPGAPASDLRAYVQLAAHAADVAGAKAATRIRTELTGKDGGALHVAHSDADMDLSNYTTEQLEAMAAIMLAAKQSDEL